MSPVDEESFEQEIASSEVSNSWLDIGVTECPLFNLSISFLQTVNLRKNWSLYFAGSKCFQLTSAINMRSAKMGLNSKFFIFIKFRNERLLSSFTWLTGGTDPAEVETVPRRHQALSLTTLMKVTRSPFQRSDNLALNILSLSLPG